MKYVTIKETLGAEVIAFINIFKLLLFYIFSRVSCQKSLRVLFRKVALLEVFFKKIQHCILKATFNFYSKP